MNQKVIPISSTRTISAAPRKCVPASQAAIDALPPASGDWSVQGVPGLYVRVGVRTKSYRLQRRVRGRLVVRVLGQMKLAQARRAAMKEWARLKPRPPEGKLTLGEAWQQYLDEKPLAPKTLRLYRENLQRYLADWANRNLEAIGEDRAGVRTLYQKLRRERGTAIAAQVMQMLGAVYRYFRRVNPDLPPCPTEVIEVVRNRPRDWALGPDELRAWWKAVEGLRSPLKRVFWLTVLLTGARRGSVEALRWADIDFDRGTIHFAVAKRGRSYSVPACRQLLNELAAWREHCPPSQAGWVFPSPSRPQQHIVAARDDKRGVASAHHLRHTYRTMLAELGATPDQARLLLGHSTGGDVSAGYITPQLLVEALRGLAEAVARRYAEILTWQAT